MTSPTGIFNKNMKKLLLIAGLLCATVIGFAQTTYSITPDSFYTKTNTDFMGHYSQETGFMGTLYTNGHFSLTDNIGYVEAYPFSKRANSFTGGATLGYELTPRFFHPTLYVKGKTNFVGRYQAEEGVMWTLWQNGHLSLVPNIGWVQNFPFTSNQHSWTAGIMLVYKF